MAQHNYGQPYYDLPFQFPPQQMQQTMPHAPPPDAHGSSQAMQPAPAPNAFYIPGLQQQAPPSNINHHAYSQNAHQPPYPQGKGSLHVTQAPLKLRLTYHSCVGAT